MIPNTAHTELSVEIRASKSFYFNKNELMMDNKSLQRLLFDADHSAYGAFRANKSLQKILFQQKLANDGQ
ncbi:hypothetical protein ASG93_23530 [Paenibacillus sp. Soil787]|nr:hypothetical protein ASG93_23530 [Paenibacillus sp. Soil787]